MLNLFITDIHTNVKFLLIHLNKFGKLIIGFYFGFCIINDCAIINLARIGALNFGYGKITCKELSNTLLNCLLSFASCFVSFLLVFIFVV